MNNLVKASVAALLVFGAPAAYAQSSDYQPGAVPELPGGSVDYWSSYWSSSANPTTTTTTTTSTNTATDTTTLTDTSSRTRIGNVDAGGLFAVGSVVSSANLASNVSGVQLHIGSTDGASTSTNGLTLGAGSFQGFAGVQSLNMNTGAAASQNAVVNLNTTAR